MIRAIPLHDDAIQPNKENRGLDICLSDTFSFYFHNKSIYLILYLFIYLLQAKGTKQRHSGNKKKAPEESTEIRLSGYLETL